MMMHLNLFLVAAVWIALIATVSVSAATEPDAAAASDFTREDIVKMELEEQEIFSAGEVYVMVASSLKDFLKIRKKFNVYVCYSSNLPY